MSGPVVARWTEASTANTKTENGMEFPKAAYAYAPDDTPSHWKIRLWETPESHETATQTARAAQALSPSGFRGQKANIPAGDLPAVRKAVLAAWKRTHTDAKPADVPAQLKESIAGEQTMSEVSELVEDAIEQKLGLPDDPAGQGVWIRDISRSHVVYCIGFGDDYFQLDYTIDDAGTVTITSDPVAVDAETSYVPDGDAVTESTDRIHGRVIEAKGSDDAGGRVFRVRIIRYGESRNGRLYPERVLSSAAPRYEGAKAYDHHRTDAEMATSTIAGLVGSYRNVAAETDGVYGDLHLLPSAQHTAEALDASLVAQNSGRPPIVGISHDVTARYQPTVTTGRRLMEATEILSVNSADVVADPAAGGQVTRMVAGGSGATTPPKEGTMNLKQLLDLLRDATPEKRAELLQEHAAVLEAAGYTVADVDVLVPVKEPVLTGATTAGGGDTGGATGAGVEGETTATESTYARANPSARRVVRDAIADAGLDERLLESVIESLPERFTESQVVAQLVGIKRTVEGLERAGLTPTVPDVQVTGEERDKKIAALDAFFARDFVKGYRSFREAYIDITGVRPKSFDEDFNRTILRESLGQGDPYDSGVRATESATTATWNLILGDSITRRLVAEYQQPNLQTWRSVVSSIVPVNDFRTQRIDRFGGYGVLPAVNQGSPYQPLTTPGNEEATYALSKRGGTEDLTLETIANDDVRLITRIPQKLGLAASQTLYRFVLDFIDTNATCSYDSTALFAAGHSNTATTALSNSAVNTSRQKMRAQTAYGDANDVLSLIPKTLIVVNTLEPLGFELTASAVALPTSAPDGGATNIPNLHVAMGLLVVDYWSSTTKWILVADPAMCPTVELGFYQGRQDPELFIQNDPTTGSVFTADKITWKIRHIYSGAILDHRGFQRGNS